MAKQCIHCGQLLPKDDARFCNECGQSQIVSTVTSAESAPIKVKLPPKELVSDDQSAAASPPLASEQDTGTARPPQTPPMAQRPSRLPKRPVRQASSGAQVPGRPSVISYKTGSMYPKSSPARNEQLEAPSTRDESPDAVPTPAKVTPDVSEESTMVLPGWQEELAQLRREHASTEEPAVSPAEPEEPVALEPDPTPWRPRNVPPSMLSQDGPSAKTEQTSQASEGEPRLQEELQADVADQLGDALVAARAVSQRASGSGTAFSSEMEEQEDEKDEAAHGEQGVAASQIDRPVPKSASDQQDVDEYATQIWEGDANDDHVADLPTTVLSVPPISVQEPPPSARERTSTPVAKSGVSAPMSKQQDEVEEQPTRPMPNNWSTPRSSTPSAGPQTPSRFADLPPLEKRPAQPTSNTVSEPGSYGQAASSAQSGPRGQGRHPSSYGSSGNVLNPPSPFPNSISQPGMATPIPETRFAGPTSRSESATPRFTAAAQPPNTPSPTPTYAIASLKQPRQTRRAGILIFLLLVLLIGGGAFWYIYYQPFTNRLAQTDQTYQNTALGFSLHYPLYWKVDYNQARSIVRFEDSSATGQVSLSRTQTAGTTQSQYVSQQEAQLGMAGQKPEPTVTFAGATWQQVRGTVNQSGATYTVTLYITQRNGYFYALTCLTIPSIYAQMEHNNFAPLRASLQFLS